MFRTPLAITMVALAFLFINPPVKAASIAGAGIEVDGKYIGGYAITLDDETREELIRNFPQHFITFERDYKIRVDAKNPKLAILEGRIHLLTRIRGDREVRAKVKRLELVMRKGRWYVSEKSLKLALNPKDAQKVEKKGLEEPGEVKASASKS